MANKKNHVDTDIDYTLTHVPVEARKNWIPIFAVIMGFTFIATTMAAGANLGTSFKLADLLLILIIGNLFLAIYSGSLSWIAAKTGLNSILLSRYALGKIGSK